MLQDTIDHNTVMRVLWKFKAELCKFNWPFSLQAKSMSFCIRHRSIYQAQKAWPARLSRTVGRAKILICTATILKLQPCT